LKFKQLPSVVFNPLNLQDDKVFKNMLLEMYDRGLLGVETLLSMNDVDFEVQYAQRKAEQSGDFEKVFAPRPKAGAVGGPGGRPTDTVDPGNYTPRDKQPAPKKSSPENPPATPKEQPKK
jgi:hypothetical protein